MVASSYVCVGYFFFFKQKTAYEMRISDWSSDVCSSDLVHLSALVDGKSPARSMVLDPARKPATTSAGQATTALTLVSPQVHVRYDRAAHKIGSAPCRERVCQYVEISVGAVSLKKIQQQQITQLKT